MYLTDEFASVMEDLTTLLASKDKLGTDEWRQTFESLGSKYQSLAEQIDAIATIPTGNFLYHQSLFENLKKLRVILDKEESGLQSWQMAFRNNVRSTSQMLLNAGIHKNFEI